MNILRVTISPFYIEQSKYLNENICNRFKQYLDIESLIILLLGNQTQRLKRKILFNDILGDQDKMRMFVRRCTTSFCHRWNFMARIRCVVAIIQWNRCIWWIVQYEKVTSLVSCLTISVCVYSPALRRALTFCYAAEESYRIKTSSTEDRVAFNGNFMVVLASYFPALCVFSAFFTFYGLFWSLLYFLYMFSILNMLQEFLSFLALCC